LIDVLINLYVILKTNSKHIIQENIFVDYCLGLKKFSIKPRMILFRILQLGLTLSYFKTLLIVILGV